MQYHDITGLGRTLHPTHVTHVIAVSVALSTFVALVVLSIVSGDVDLLGAAAGAVAVFVAWVAARELDPDAPGAATVAIAVAMVIAVIVVPSAIVAGCAAIALRLIAGTVGAAITSLDVVVLFGVGIVATLDPALWIVALAIGIWIASAPEVGRRRGVGTAIFVVGCAVGLGYGWVTEWSSGGIASDVTLTAYVLAAVAAGTMAVAARPVPVHSTTDAGGVPVRAERVRLARLAAGSFCMWAAVMAGVDGFWAISPIFAALAATALFRFFVHPA